MTTTCTPVERDCLTTPASNGISPNCPDFEEDVLCEPIGTVEDEDALADKMLEDEDVDDDVVEHNFICGVDDEEDEYYYGEEYYGERVAKPHVLDTDRICYGTVEDSGYPEGKDELHWRIRFDEKDAAIHDTDDGVIEKDEYEDLDFEELMVALALCKQLRENNK